MGSGEELGGDCWWGVGEGGGGFVVCGVGNPGEEEGFAAFDAGAAGAAVAGVAFVAGPGFAVVDVEAVAEPGDGGFVEVDEGAEQFDTGVGAFGHGGGHGVHEGFAAVGVDGVVAGVGGDDEGVRATTFSKAGGDGEHDGVAKGDDCALHGFLGVVAVGNLTAGLEEIGGEELVDEGKRNDVVVDPAEVIAMPGGEGDFFGVVLRAVVKADGADDFVVLTGPVEGGDGIHAAGE